MASCAGRLPDSHHHPRPASASTADHTRKLTFLKAGPEKQVYNLHRLPTPVSAYQLMAGTVIAATWLTTRRQVRQHRRRRPGARARGLTAHHPARRLLDCGVLLDRYGPRLVDSALLLAAPGLGVAVGLMAGLVLWFPPERVALANGCYIMLGALSATGPAEVLVQSVSWRGLFAILALRPRR